MREQKAAISLPDGLPPFIPYAGAGQPKGGWFYFDENGTMKNGWFLDADGYEVNEAGE
ncbi:hypothetical protein [Clostridium sp. AN503]|uniref:hypothetical protein n=1 Tax=Clostridium sp. AN503 TaxID=3160598 RepID=UPI00345ADCF6